VREAEDGRSGQCQSESVRSGGYCWDGRRRWPDALVECCASDTPNYFSRGTETRARI
jgi:hypothetical protein